MSASLPRIDDGLSAAPVFAEEDGVLHLLGSVCQRCAAVAFPCRAVCIRCGGGQEVRRLGGLGKLHSWTRIANPPAGFDYEVLYGCVDLDEGPRVLAPLIGGNPHIGDQVRAVPAPGAHGMAGFRFEVRHA